MTKQIITIIAFMNPFNNTISENTMRKEEYIDLVISKIENKKARREIEKELSVHIDDRISYYVDAGYDEQTAIEKAVEHMGKPEIVADKMALLHRGIDFQRLFSPKSIARAIIAFLFLSVLLAFILSFGSAPFKIYLIEKKMPDNYAQMQEDYRKYNEFDFMGLYYDCEEPIDYNITTEAEGYFGIWHIVNGRLKPTAKLPSQLSFSPTWVLNDDWNYLFYVLSDNDHKGVFGGVSVKADLISQYDFLTGRLSAVKVGDTDITDFFTQKEIDLFRKTIEASNKNYVDFKNAGFDNASDEFYDESDVISNGKIKKCLNFYWYYEGLEELYLEKGVVIQTYDGKIYLAMRIWKDDYEIKADGGLRLLIGEEKEKMQKVIETANETTPSFDRYKIVEEMKNSVKK